MKQISIFIFMLLFLSLSMNAHESAIGFGIGNTPMYDFGFSYRHYFEKNFGLSSIVGGRLFFGDQNINIGGSLSPLYTLRKINFNSTRLPDLEFKFYGLIATTLSYSREKYPKFITTPISESYVLSEKKNIVMLGVGPGLGCELNFTKNLAINIEFPWITSFNITNKFLLTKSSLAVSAGFTFYL